MATPLPPSAFHHVDEHRVTHDVDLETLHVGDVLDRFLGVIKVARARIHDGETDQVRVWAVGDLVEQFLADRPVNDLIHMRFCHETGTAD